MLGVGMSTTTQGPKLYRLLWAEAGKGLLIQKEGFLVSYSSSHNEHLLYVAGRFLHLAWPRGPLPLFPPGPMIPQLLIK